jgi:hypothetical protein
VSPVAAIVGRGLTSSVKDPGFAHTGKPFHLNMLSAVSAKGELRFMTSRKRISAALFIDFLRRLITNYPRKTLLVADEPLMIKSVGVSSRSSPNKPEDTPLAPSQM